MSSCRTRGSVKDASSSFTAASIELTAEVSTLWMDSGSTVLRAIPPLLDTSDRRYVRGGGGGEGGGRVSVCLPVCRIQ